MKLDLKNMNAPEMMDVLHYFFEEDMKSSSEDELYSTSKVRTELYSWYGVNYVYQVHQTIDRKYADTKNGGNNRSYAGPDTSEFDFLDDVSTELKPYVPPTEPDADSYMPFGEILDAPLK